MQFSIKNFSNQLPLHVLKMKHILKLFLYLFNKTSNFNIYESKQSLSF